LRAAARQRAAEAVAVADHPVAAEAEVADPPQAVAAVAACRREAAGVADGPAPDRRVGVGSGSVRSAVPAARGDAGFVALQGRVIGFVALQDPVAGFPHPADQAGRGVAAAAAWSPARFCLIAPDTSCQSG
jgi:hypothetical protein